MKLNDNINSNMNRILLSLTFLISSSLTNEWERAMFKDGTGFYVRYTNTDIIHISCFPSVTHIVISSKNLDQLKRCSEITDCGSDKICCNGLCYDVK